MSPCWIMPVITPSTSPRSPSKHSSSSAVAPPSQHSSITTVEPVPTAVGGESQNEQPGDCVASHQSCTSLECLSSVLIGSNSSLIRSILTTVSVSAPGLASTSASTSPCVSSRLALVALLPSFAGAGTALSNVSMYDVDLDLERGGIEDFPEMVTGEANGSDAAAEIF